MSVCSLLYTEFKIFYIDNSPKLTLLDGSMYEHLTGDFTVPCVWTDHHFTSLVGRTISIQWLLLFYTTTSNVEQHLYHQILILIFKDMTWELTTSLRWLSLSPLGDHLQRVCMIEKIYIYPFGVLPTLSHMSIISAQSSLVFISLVAFSVHNKQKIKSHS